MAGVDVRVSARRAGVRTRHNMIENYNLKGFCCLSRDFSLGYTTHIQVMYTFGWIKPSETHMVVTDSSMESV